MVFGVSLEMQSDSKSYVSVQDDEITELVHAIKSARAWHPFTLASAVIQARNQDFMWGGANEAKVDQTTEMYFLLSDPFIQESSDTWKVLTTKYAVGTEYYICRIQLFE